MSDRRDELAALRKRLIMGDPPYVIDEVMQTKKRHGGAPGLDELKAIGDYAPGAASLRLLFESQIAFIDHMLERTR